MSSDAVTQWGYQSIAAKEAFVLITCRLVIPAISLFEWLTKITHGNSKQESNLSSVCVSVYMQVYLFDFCVLPLYDSLMFFSVPSSLVQGFSHADMYREFTGIVPVHLLFQPILLKLLLSAIPVDSGCFLYCSVMGPLCTRAFGSASIFVSQLYIVLAPYAQSWCSMNPPPDTLTSACSA